MSEPAGVVNDRGQKNEAAFSDLIGSSSPEIQEVARAVRDLVYDVLPETVEVVWARQSTRQGIPAPHR